MAPKGRSLGSLAIAGARRVRYSWHRNGMPRLERIEDWSLNALRRRRPAPVDRSALAADRVIWIFGSARTGSTWLSSMMGEPTGHAVWREPLVGALFGNFYYDRARNRSVQPHGKHFILGARYRETWLAQIRAFVLDGAEVRFPGARTGYVVIKEPNGSIGAPLMMEALPESRMVLLVRDPRDVVASSMDARRGDSWLATNRGRGGKDTLRDRKPDAYVRKRAEALIEQFGNAIQAYEAHRGSKALVRYEELRDDTVGTLRRMYSALGVAVDDDTLRHAADKHAWEGIPEELKGEGRFHRKAKPGGWREDLTPEQAGVVARITAPLLGELYPDAARAAQQLRQAGG